MEAAHLCSARRLNCLESFLCCHISHTGMDISWCKAPDVGLPAPDLVIYLSISNDVAAARAGFGGERYEKTDFQDKVGQHSSSCCVPSASRCCCNPTPPFVDWYTAEAAHILVFVLMRASTLACLHGACCQLMPETVYWGRASRLSLSSQSPAALQWGSTSQTPFRHIHDSML